jgi:hypothetical protein
MPTDRADANDEAEALGARKHPHGDVEHWLEGNPQDRELNKDDLPAGSATASSDERTTLTETGQLQRNLEGDAAEQVFT